MKPIFYQLTKKGQEKNFDEDFFMFFPEEVKIVHLLKLKPMSVNMIMKQINRIEEDEYKRPIGKNPFGEKKSRSYDFFLSKVKTLIKGGFIEKK